MIEHDLRPSTPPAPGSGPAGARPEPPATALQAYHRAAHAIPHRRYWYRPLVTLLVSVVVLAVMTLQLLLVLTIAGAIWPSFAPSPSLADPLNPVDQLMSLGMLALLIPAVLIGTLAGYGRAGIAFSVLGRFRWRLLGRAALVVVPVYVLVNMVLNLVLEREAIVVPPLGTGVLGAWLIALVLAPLQSAGEEFVFRALPMQLLGTWLRWPLVGILVPVPLFVLGHGYDWAGQLHIALFAIAMGLLAWKTGGLELPILLHVANNWTLFAIAPLIPGFTEQGEVGALGLLLALVPMVALSAGIWWWYSRRAGLGLWEPQRGAVQTLSPSAAITSSARAVRGERSMI